MSEVILGATSCFSLWQRAKNAFQNRRDGAKRALAAANKKIAEGKKVPLFRKEDLLNPRANTYLYEEYSPDEQRLLRKLAPVHGFLKPNAYPRQPQP
ncbi:MAG: hypothetical protein WC612_05660 [Bdellovibrionales bacterium]